MKKIIHILFLSFFISFIRCEAGQLPASESVVTGTDIRNIFNSNSNNTSLVLFHQDLNLVFQGSPGQTVKNIINEVRLEFDPVFPLSNLGEFELALTFDIDAFDINGISTSYTNQTLSITYNPIEGTKYIDLDFAFKKVKPITKAIIDSDII